MTPCDARAVSLETYGFPADALDDAQKTLEEVLVQDPRNKRRRKTRGPDGAGAGTGASYRIPFAGLDVDFRVDESRTVVVEAVAAGAEDGDLREDGGRGVVCLCSRRWRLARPPSTRRYRRAAMAFSSGEGMSVANMRSISATFDLSSFGNFDKSSISSNASRKSSTSGKSPRVRPYRLAHFANCRGKSANSFCCFSSLPKNWGICFLR